MKHNPHLTAITRKQLPRPTRWLLRNGYLLKHKFIPMLDFGCGKCHSVNNEHLHIDGYDPHFRPDGIPEGKQYQIIEAKSNRWQDCLSSMKTRLGKLFC